MIHPPFYSDALRAWRIESDDASETILVPTLEEATTVYEAALAEGWHTAQRIAREARFRDDYRREQERERQLKRQMEKPQ